MKDLTDRINLSKCIEHFFMMRRVQKAGGLRKELTPEICVSMHILFNYENITHLEAVVLASHIKGIVRELDNIPF
jgi:hypothetical protein